MDAADVVGRGDEQDFRQVVVDVEVVVVESGVLLGIQGLQQGGGRVAVDVFRHLVDFVEDDDGVGGAGALDGLDDTARHGADVGLAVAADFRLVVQAAEGDPSILAPQCPGD